VSVSLSRPALHQREIPAAMAADADLQHQAGDDRDEVPGNA
jgi:hypothetical protein